MPVLDLPTPEGWKAELIYANVGELLAAKSKTLLVYSSIIVTILRYEIVMN